MKHTLPLIYLLLFSFFLRAQNPSLAWAKNTGTNGYALGKAMTTDAAGNVYTSGSFTGTVDFDPGPGIYNQNAGTFPGLFISKFNAEGDLLWVKSIVNSESTLPAGYGLDVDGAGNVYITGLYSTGLNAQTDFDPGPGTYFLNSAGGTAFVLKLDASGNFLWARNFKNSQASGYTIGSYGHDVKVDAAGNVYAAGYFTGTVDFDPGPGIYNLSADGQADTYTVKLNASGDLVWAEKLGSSISASAGSLFLDTDGNVYETGSFTGAADFDPGPGAYILSTGGNPNMYVLKLDPNGNFIYARSVGAGGSAFATGIAVDRTGTVYTAGWFSGTADLDPGPGTTYLNTANGGAFLSKWDAAGNLVWVKNYGSRTSNGYTVSLDAAGNVYTAGKFTGTGDFDPGPEIYNLTAASTDNLFISSFDAAGNLRWARATGGKLFAVGKCMGLDGAGNIYAAGYFIGNANFDPGPSTFTLTSSARENLFALKWTQLFVCTPPTFLNDLTIVLDASECGNDGLITIIPTSGTAPFMYSIDGGATYVEGPATGYSFQGLAAGMYQLRLKDAKGCESAVVTREVKVLFPCPAKCTKPTFRNDNTILLDASCQGNDGNISIIPTSGTAPFMYSIDGGMTYVEGPATGYTFMNLAAGTYQLRLKDSKGCESEVVTREVNPDAFGPCNVTTVSPRQRVQNPASLAEVTAYPNPSSGQFQVQLKRFGAQTVQVQILDSRGVVVEQRRVNAEQSTTLPINLSNRAKGLYLIRVVSDQGIQVQKVTIQ